MSEPDFLVQTADNLMPHERDEWLREQMEVVRAEGYTYARASLSVDQTILLLEAWRDRPAEEGEPRFQLEVVG